MEPNLIKDEGGLDLHPKKTVICPKKKYRESLLNVNSKDFKTKKDRKKNRRTIRRNKLTSKTPLKPMIKNILPEEDLDTKSSDDDNDPRLLQFDDAQMPGCGSEDFEDSENFDNEEPASTESEIMFTRPLPSPDASFIFALFGGKRRMVLESDSDDEINLSD